MVTVIWKKFLKQEIVLKLDISHRNVVFVQFRRSQIPRTTVRNVETVQSLGQEEDQTV